MTSAVETLIDGMAHFEAMTGMKGAEIRIGKEALDRLRREVHGSLLHPTPDGLAPTLNGAVLRVRE